MFPSARDKPLLSVDFFSAAYESTNKILLSIIFVFAIPPYYHFSRLSFQRKSCRTVSNKLVKNSMQKIFQYISFQNYF